MRMGPQPHDLDVLEEGDVHRRRQIVAFIGRNRKFWIVRGSEYGPVIRGSWLGDWRILARALHDELLRRRCLRNREADLSSVCDCLAVGRVMQTHDNIRSGRYELSGIPDAVVVVAGARQVAKIQVLPQGGVAFSELHFGAAHVAGGDGHIRQFSKSAVAGSGIAAVISRHLHPLVPVVDRVGPMLFEAEANVMHHRCVARQNLHGRDPGVAFERRGQRDQLPLQNALGRHIARRHVQDDFRLDAPAARGPLNRGGRVLGQPAASRG